MMALPRLITETGRFLQNRLHTWGGRRTARALAGERVAVYFAGGMSSLYQLAQWMPALSRLQEVEPVAFIIRDAGAYRAFAAAYPESRAYFAPGLPALMGLFAGATLRSVLYVNNAVRNFQALGYRDALHVHLNHGESEKESMSSNQAKAYDRVFVVGEAAVDRYMNRLIAFDRTRLVAVGRPQIEAVEPRGFPRAAGRRIVLYAPTWEGTHEDMNYCSLVVAGGELARAVLAEPGAYLVYRPHPATGVNSPRIRQADAAIRAMIAASADGGELAADGDVNAIFPAVDFAVFDNSSVVVDYLAADKPFVVVDVGFAGQFPAGVPRILSEAPLLAPEDAASVPALMAEHLAHDPAAAARRALRRYYLGDDGPGEATRRFVEAVLATAALADTLVERRDGRQPRSAPANRGGSAG